jgi:hypothetical protein
MFTTLAPIVNLLNKLSFMFFIFYLSGPTCNHCCRLIILIRVDSISPPIVKAPTISDRCYIYYLNYTYATASAVATLAGIATSSPANAKSSTEALAA